MAETDWLSTKGASAYLETLGCFVAPKTLANLRVNANAGKGPPFTRTMWKTVRYQRSDLATWAAANTERFK